MHLLIMCLFVSSLSPHNLYLSFCSVLTILTLIWVVLMALFCAAIRRDLVSFLRFPLFSHVHVYSCEMSVVSLLKPPRGCFSSHFLFSGYCRSAGPRVVSIVSGAVISLPQRFSMWPSCRCIEASTLSSMLTSPLSPSLLYIYNLSTLSLRCNALWMGIRFLVLWSIC